MQATLNSTQLSPEFAERYLLPAVSGITRRAGTDYILRRRNKRRHCLYIKLLESIFDNMVAINLNPFPKLSATRLLLRQLQLSDANEIFLLRADDSVNAFIDRQKAASIDDATAHINKIIVLQNNSEGLMWAITLRNNPKLIGAIGIWNIIKEKAEAEIGYELLPQYQGKGIMQEALKTVLKFGFGTLKLKTIVADSRADNLRSVKLLEKCGFTKTVETHGAYLIYKLSGNS